MMHGQVSAFVVVLGASRNNGGASGCSTRSGKILAFGNWSALFHPGLS